MESQINNESSAAAITCENCNSVNEAIKKYCSQCSFPIGGTEDEQRNFRLTVSSRKRLLSDAIDKIKSAKQIMYILAGLIFVFGLVQGFANDDFGTMIVNLFISLIYLILAAWANKNPFGAILTAFIIYVSLILINAFIQPSTLISGIILKAIVIGGFIKGTRSAKEAQEYLKELEKLKAAPSGGN